MTTLKSALLYTYILLLVDAFTPSAIISFPSSFKHLILPSHSLVQQQQKQQPHMTSRYSSTETDPVQPSSVFESRNHLLLSKLSNLSVDGPQRLILASQSPRRREILDMMGLANRYTVTFSPLDEASLQMELANHPSISPPEYAQKLAESKAHALALHMVADSSGVEKTHSSGGHNVSSSFILGSDTIVDKDGCILEKPKDEEDAKRMLHMLSGTWHEVHTGVAVYKINHGTEEIVLVSSFTETAKVKFTTLCEEDILAYIQTGEPMDKAGAYGIQGIGGQMVERMEGDFFAVMGLPMHRLSGELAKALTL